MDYDTDSRAKMIMGASAIRYLQEKYNGQSIYFSFNQSLFPLSGIDPQNYGYEMGGSITTALLGMVRSAGFKTIILMGQDLAYDENGFSHTGGEREERENDQWLEGIYGGKVRVRSDWVLFLKSFEKEIREHPEMTVIDATEGGALIHGSAVMTMREAIDLYCRKEYPVQEWIDSLSKNGESCRIEVEQIMVRHYSRICQTGDRLGEILKIGTSLLQQCEKGRLGAAENADYCARYDRLYAEIINNGSDELMLMYCDDIIQRYVIRAMTLEGDDIVGKRMQFELELFEGMLIRNKELNAYIRELFPFVERKE